MTTLSENRYTRQDLERKLALAESNLKFHEVEAERYRLRVVAIQQELGTLPVEKEKV
jgi:hypothetical protein